jgi:predicted HTH domain antitoxin
VTIEIPDALAVGEFTPQELQLELACALYSRGRIGKLAGAEMAGVDFFTFQKALGERQIPIVTEKMLAADVNALKELFPR